MFKSIKRFVDKAMANTLSFNGMWAYEPPSDPEPLSPEQLKKRDIWEQPQLQLNGAQ